MIVMIETLIFIQMLMKSDDIHNDNDCDGAIDEASAIDALEWFLDHDQDGFGDPAISQMSCEQPNLYVLNDSDCYDLSAEAYPGGTEICDGLDNDCNGTEDEAGALGELTWYIDEDGDGFGVSESTTLSCQQPDGYADNTQDCDDDDIDVSPLGVETCATDYDDNYVMASSTNSVLW